MDIKKVLVTGSTGKQGGAVTQALLARGGFEVFGLCRNPDSAKAKELKAKGVTVLKGDLLNKAELVTAFKQVDGVFMVTTPEPFNAEGCEVEKRQGFTMAEAAKEANIKFIIYSSVCASTKKTGIPHFDSKAIIEEAIKNTGVPTFILKPVCFFDNIDMPGAELKQGKFTFLTSPETSLQWIACSDIGEFVAIGFSDPTRFAGTVLDIAGDQCTGPEIAQQLSEIRNKELWTYSNPPLFILNCFAKEIGVMTNWFITNQHGVGKSGYDADIEKCRSINPKLMDKEAYLRSMGYDKATFPAAGSCSIM